MGGHGYSAYNAIGGLIADFGVITTGGGDNGVLFQQTAKFLLQGYRKHKMGVEFPADSILHFLNTTPSDTQLSPPPLEDWQTTMSSPAYQVESMRQLTLVLLSKLAMSFLAAKNQTQAEMWNDNLLALREMTRPFTTWFLLQRFVQIENRLEPSPVKQILGQCRELVWLSHLEKMADLFLEAELLHSGHVSAMRARLQAQCKSLRGVAVTLTDAFDYPDWVLKAPIARYDGQMYHHYWAEIQEMNAAERLKSKL